MTGPLITLILLVTDCRGFTYVETQMEVLHRVEISWLLHFLVVNAQQQRFPIMDNNTMIVVIMEEARFTVTTLNCNRLGLLTADNDDESLSLIKWRSLI